jgi:hypothetical protein
MVRSIEKEPLELKVTSTIFSSYIQVVELKIFISFWMMNSYKFLGQ